MVIVGVCVSDRRPSMSVNFRAQVVIVQLRGRPVEHYLYDLFITSINDKNFHGSLTTVVRAQNDTPKTANITCTIFDRTLV